MKTAPFPTIIYTAVVIGLLCAAVMDVHTISGSSMSPTYSDSETVFVFRWAYGLQAPFIHRYIVQWGEVKKGDIVVLREPARHKRVVKRCNDTRNGKIYVLGDNPEKSRDSRHYGYIARSKIEGKVLQLP